jgi:hypothetical protein
VAAVNGGANAYGCTSTGAGYGSGDAIVFDSSLAGSSIPVTASGQIQITKTLTITGLLDANDKPNITLDGNNVNGILSASGGNSLTITGVEFINSYGLGGAVSADGNVTVSNSTFSGNWTRGVSGSPGGGGGVHAGGNATISNSTFSGNSSNGGGQSGGAVYAYGNVTISNSTFSGNSSIGSSGGAVATYAGNVTISNSTFSGNWTQNGAGGAVSATNATISNSTFSGNSSQNVGGAMHVDSLDARHVTFLNNTSNGGQAVAIWDTGTPSLSTLHNSIIIGSRSSPQCHGPIGALGTITGSNNLEGYYDASGNWQGSSTTCGTNIATMPNVGDALSAILSSTLADNGGPTQTLALPTGSPATGAADRTGGTSQMLDAAGNWVDATLDQRGYARPPVASGRDVGAYEINVQPSPALRPVVPTLPAALLGVLGLLLAGFVFVRRRQPGADPF